MTGHYRWLQRLLLRRPNHARSKKSAFSTVLSKTQRSLHTVQSRRSFAPGTISDAARAGLICSNSAMIRHHRRSFGTDPNDPGWERTANMTAQRPHIDSHSEDKHDDEPLPVFNRLVRALAIGSHIESALKASRVIKDPAVVSLVASTISVGIYAFLGVSFLDKFGIDTTPFIAAFSVGGAALGFGLKDIASNYVSGILLVLERNFQYNDLVTIGGGYKGRVRQMSLRHIQLDVFDDASKKFSHSIYVPNSTVFSNVVQVHERSKFSRVVSIQQETTPDK